MDNDANKDDLATAEFEKQQAEVQGDEEISHGMADSFLVKTLRENGFPKLADAFDKASEDFWYA